MEERKIPGEGYQILGQRMIYEMPKELDHHVAKEICQELDILIEANGIYELCLDFSSTEFMDSSGIGVVLGRGRLMNFRKGKITACHMKRRVRMLFQAAGLEKIVEVEEE